MTRYSLPSLLEGTEKENLVGFININNQRHSLFAFPTALLVAISDRIIPGIPDNLRILLVSQVDIGEERFLLAGEDDKARYNSELTVTERVVKTDRRRNKALQEQEGFEPHRNFQQQYITILDSFIESSRVHFFYCNCEGCSFYSSIKGKGRSRGS